MSIGVILMSVACSSSVEEGSKEFVVFAHRGAKGYVLENTVPSFKKALELNAKAVELDVFRCATGEIVVFHDETLDRLSDRQDSIEALTLEQLEEVNLTEGKKIPTLKEVLDLFRSKDILVNIELKGANTAEGVHELLSGLGETKAKFVISSFNWDELKKMRALNNTVSIAVLTAENPVDAIEFAHEINAASINPNAVDVNSSVVQSIHDEGMKIYAWTVNDEGALKNLVYMGVDGVFSDYPDSAEIWSKEVMSLSL